MNGYDLNEILEAFGDGNADRGEHNLKALAARLAHARKKHPVFADGGYHALGFSLAEYQELERAVCNESIERQTDEALDVAATAMRFVNGEHRTA